MGDCGVRKITPKEVHDFIALKLNEIKAKCFTDDTELTFVMRVPSDETHETSLILSNDDLDGVCNCIKHLKEKGPDPVIEKGE